ncbi:MAG: adenine deaminase [Lachnospiraceae bacterium]|nr:adenine deaminase [Lachnospiraceae bacterium]
MKTLLKNAKIVNVFTDSLMDADVLIEDDKIIGLGDYSDTNADICEDLKGKYICPGFIDGHIHIESTMMTPYELSKAVLPCGTTSIVADPHEIANVCGTDGIKYIIEASEGLPLKVYIMLPSCVPATPFDESGCVLKAEDLKPFYKEKRVLGLAEMMNYPGAISGDLDILNKIKDAFDNNKVVDGHAPLLTGHGLDAYISRGIQSDHECSSYEEGKERISKGQWLMVREGTAAKNLLNMIDLLDEPFSRRCVLVTDDKHPADILRDGHIDHIIRLAVKNGKSVFTAIRVATIQAANCFGLKYTGAVAPGYKADLLVLNNLEEIDIKDVYSEGKKVVENKKLKEYDKPSISKQLVNKVTNSFFIDKLTEKDFILSKEANKCRVIKTIKGQLLTDEWITEMNFETSNGIDLERDILKIAVLERHHNTGHKGIGFINGIGLKEGAIACSVSHDSHNLIVIGSNEADMACVANAIIEMGGGCAAAKNGKIVSSLPLPIAGLMSEDDASLLAEKNHVLREAIYELGVPRTIAPLMTMAFVSLAVIPSLKLITTGLFDVNSFSPTDLFVK